MEEDDVKWVGSLGVCTDLMLMLWQSLIENWQLGTTVGTSKVTHFVAVINVIDIA